MDRSNFPEPAGQLESATDRLAAMLFRSSGTSPPSCFVELLPGEELDAMSDISRNTTPAKVSACRSEDLLLGLLFPAAQ